MNYSPHSKLFILKRDRVTEWQTKWILIKNILKNHVNVSKIALPHKNVSQKKIHFNLPNGILANDGMKKKADDSKHTAIEY